MAGSSLTSHLKNLMPTSLQDAAAQLKCRISQSRTYTIKGRTLEEEKKLSEGGFAFVYLVRDTATHEVFALKKMLCQDAERHRLAADEAALMSRLPEHPNIVGYFGHSTEKHGDGRPKEVNILLEFCPNGHILDLLESCGGKLSVAQIVRVLLDVTGALAFLHAQNPPIQHRDLKVENILINRHGNYVLCDFGSCSQSTPADTSKLPRMELLRLEEIIEKNTTLQYRPPEMVDLYKGYIIDRQVDMWMLGCVLFSLMFYRHPFQDESPLAIANAKYFIDPAEEARFPRKLVELLHWLLAMNPRDRPTSMQLINLLVDFESLPDKAGSIPLPESVREKLARNDRLYGSAQPPLSKVKKNKKKKPPKAALPSHAEETFADFEGSHPGVATGDMLTWALSSPDPSQAPPNVASIAVDKHNESWTASFDSQQQQQSASSDLWTGTFGDFQSASAAAVAVGDASMKWPEEPGAMGDQQTDSLFESAEEPHGDRPGIRKCKAPSADFINIESIESQVVARPAPNAPVVDLLGSP